MEWLKLIRDLFVWICWITLLVNDLVKSYKKATKKIADEDKNAWDRELEQQILRNVIFVWYFAWAATQR